MLFVFMKLGVMHVYPLYTGGPNPVYSERMGEKYIPHEGSEASQDPPFKQSLDFTPTNVYPTLQR